jgi:hypothetical protein
MTFASTLVVGQMAGYVIIVLGSVQAPDSLALVAYAGTNFEMYTILRHFANVTQVSM